MGGPKNKTLSPRQIRRRVELARRLMRIAAPRMTDLDGAVGEARTYETDRGSVRALVYGYERPGIRPLLVNIHGSGFVMGSAAMDDPFMMQFVEKCGVRVLSIDYPLSPDVMFPTALEKCYALVRYAREHAEEMRIDPDRIMLISQITAYWRLHDRQMSGMMIPRPGKTKVWPHTRRYHEKRNERHEKNPVIRTAGWAVSMMKNKIVITLMMLVTGILFLAAPAGNVNGTVIFAAVVLLAAAVINIGIHLIPKGRTKTDALLAAFNAAIAVFAVFCLVSPATVEPYVRTAVGVMTILSNLFNLIEVFRLENKRTWRFFFGLFTAVIMIGLGIGMIVAGEAVIASMQQGIGIFLIINALVNLWYIIRLGTAGKKA